MNKLLYGDNLTIMQGMPLQGVDLIYLDPPFNSKKDYNLLYKKLTGKPVPEQAEAFCDTWEMDAEKEAIAYHMPVLMQEKGVESFYIEFWRMWMLALRNTQPHLLAYLIYMVQRLLYMRTLLKSTGSIYLHCDPTASHYIKVMMDGIFGHKNFRNEIIWKRTSAHSSSRRFGPVHDTILFYTNSDKYRWNSPTQAYEQAHIDSKYRQSDARGSHALSDLTGAGVRHGDSGEPWRDFNPTAMGRHWAISRSALASVIGTADASKMTTQEKLDLLDKEGFIYWPKRGRGDSAGFPRFRRHLGSGVPVQDVITDIFPLNSQSNERLGYPTQKPVELLERIINASSNPGDVVFDPFCGCGTTIYAAAKTGREWIGCDIAILSIRLIQDVLSSKYLLSEGVHFEVSGIPNSVDSAEALFKKDPFQFQHWFVEKVGGFPMKKKTADRGIDGRIYFETRDGFKQVILSVKGGNLNPTDVRDLRGVLDREEGAAIGGLLSLQEPTRGMRQEAASGGMYEYNGVGYERIQLLSVREMLEDRRELNTPSKVAAKHVTGQGQLAL